MSPACCSTSPSAWGTSSTATSSSASSGAPRRRATRSVDIAIARLRKKIEPDVHHPRFIQTVHGDGYTLTRMRTAEVRLCEKGDGRGLWWQCWSARWAARRLSRQPRRRRVPPRGTVS